jgi:fatty-acyl-CoA synthase
MDATLTQVLARAAALNKPETGLRYLDRRERETWVSFPDLASRAAKVAGGLLTMGVQRGDTVAIVMPTVPEFTDVFFGVIHLGAIPVPLYPPVRLGRLDEYHSRTAAMLNTAKARVLVTDDRAGKLMGTTVAAAKAPIRIVRAASLLRSEPAPAVTTRPQDIAMVQFSSGTTGEPKPVALTHAQVLANASVILDIEPEDDDFSPSGVTWLPLYHDMGLIGCIFPALLYPASLTLIPPEAFLAKPAIWLRALSRYRGVISPAPNFAYALCTERITDDEITGIDLSGWRFALNGAEATSPDIMRAFIERFSEYGLRESALTPVYGLSEAALAVSFGDPGTDFVSERFSREGLTAGRGEPAEDGMELASVGRALRGFAIEVRKDGAVLGSGLIGHIWVKGPSVMEGYLDGRPAPKDGDWLDTGDLGFLHQDELYITGRAKDVLVVHGRNHDPHTLESAVDPLPGVRTGCSAAVSHLSNHGERVLLFVETRAPTPSDMSDQIIDSIRAATAVTVDEVILLKPGTLPRTSSGKIRRAATLTHWLQGTLSPPETMGATRLLGAVAKSTLSEWRSRGVSRD